jgi:hypothetical protein
LGDHLHLQSIVKSEVTLNYTWYFYFLSLISWLFLVESHIMNVLILHFYSYLLVWVSIRVHTTDWFSTWWLLDLQRSWLCM